MSLTNPKNVVTEERLQEFYHRIKNYLGFTEMPSEDMAEIVTPKPSARARYHKYSTEEQVVGEWIDGKPLYQKTIKGTLPTSINTTQTFADHNISNIENIQIVSSCVKATDGTWYEVGTGTVWTAWINNVNIRNQIGTNALVSQIGYITIQYTKSTD